MIKNGQPGPFKARVHVSPTKQMVLAFFGGNKLIFTKMVKIGKCVNSVFNVDTLDAFQDFEAEEASAGGAGLDVPLANGPVHTAAEGLKLQVNHKIQAIKNKLHSLDLSTADYGLLSKEKYLPYLLRLTQEAMKTTLDGVQHIIIKDKFAAAFRRW